MSAFEELGGEPKLRPIIKDFVRTMVKDAMIGFLFTGVDRFRLENMEYLFTARFLGADVEYPGRPITQAHAAHRIMGGQFDRRREILRRTLEKHDVPPHIQAQWLHHTDALRSAITQQNPGECID